MPQLRPRIANQPNKHKALSPVQFDLFVLFLLSSYVSNLFQILSSEIPSRNSFIGTLFSSHYFDNFSASFNNRKEIVLALQYVYSEPMVLSKYQNFILHLALGLIINTIVPEINLNLSQQFLLHSFSLEIKNIFATFGHLYCCSYVNHFTKIYVCYKYIYKFSQ